MRSSTSLEAFKARNRQGQVLDLITNHKLLSGPPKMKICRSVMLLGILMVPLEDQRPQLESGPRSKQRHTWRSYVKSHRVTPPFLKMQPMSSFWLINSYACARGTNCISDEQPLNLHSATIMNATVATREVKVMSAIVGWTVRSNLSRYLIYPSQSSLGRYPHCLFHKAKVLYWVLQRLFNAWLGFMACSLLSLLGIRLEGGFGDPWT